MRILFIHSNYFEYQVESKTKFAEELENDDLKHKKMEDGLTCFISVEKDDEAQSELVVEKGTEEINDVAEKINTKRIMLYPYAHLSSSLSAPKQAIEILKGLEKKLKLQGYEVVRSPFGWYKSFQIECKGHPLSELSRQITIEPEKKVTKKIGKERFLILLSNGEEFEPNDYKFKSSEKAFKVMVEKEALKKEAKTIGEPNYLRLCKKFGIEWEEMSDAGHMRYHPKAALMFDLLADYSTHTVNSLGIPIFSIKGTNIFDLSEKAVSEHADLYGDRLYTIKHKDERKDFVMRYAACHQQFAMVKQWNISYKHLPFGVFEVADAYRLEQSGECMLCFRTRRMNMPDLHIFCKDETQAEEWFEKTHAKIYEEIRKLGRDYEMLINFSSFEAYINNRNLITKILRNTNKPALLHFYPGGTNYYWTVNIEYHILDHLHRAREISTVQIDIGNAERFGIKYSDEHGEKKYPIILHTAILGTIERFFYTIFDTEVLNEDQGKIGCLPLWLNPEQIRLLTISDKHLERAQKIANHLENQNIRVGVDNRMESINKKVKEAKQDWVGYVIVIGDRELKTDSLKVYNRSKNQDEEYTLERLISELKVKTKEMPFRKMYFPKEMTKRPVFRG